LKNEKLRMGKKGKGKGVGKMVVSDMPQQLKMMKWRGLCLAFEGLK